MPAKLTENQINLKAKQFLSTHNVPSLEQLIRVPKFSISLHAASPDYLYFKIPKPKGGFREIEAPFPELKKIQRKISEYLQYVYFLQKISPSHGFIINPRGKNPKNIVSNATGHIGNDYVLNIDFDDFFHQIKIEKVVEILSSYPFSFPKNMVHILAKLCTNKGRLPMGAPTSPVLSNLACMNLDARLLWYAQSHHWVYTRFVDDLTFSSKSPIQPFFDELIQVIQSFDFKIDPQKTKWFEPHQIKMVTGLCISDKVDIPPDFYKELDTDLLRLKHVNEVHYLTGAVHKADALKKFKQQVMGKINFIAVVLGYDNVHYTTFFQKYEQALQPPDEALTMRWTKFSNYQF